MSLASNGFGEVLPGARQSVVFKRKWYSQMSIENQKLMDELEVDMQSYEDIVTADEGVSKKKKVAK